MRLGIGRWLAILTVVCASAAAGAPVANAVVPGPNGRVAFRGPTGAEGTALFTANPDGSAVRIVAGSDDARHPAWSPDGTRLAYATEAGIAISNADGSGKSLITSHGVGSLPDFAPDWSPDGARIAFTRPVPGNHQEIFTVAIDGNDLHQVTDDPDLNSSTPRWSPDGGKLLFSRHEEFSLIYSLWTANPDGSDLHSIVVRPGEGAKDGAWSPDGTQIVYERGTCCPESAYIVNTDGTGDHIIAPRVSWPTWSPDGSQILFVNRDDEIGSGRSLDPLASRPVAGGPITSLNLAALDAAWGTAPHLTGDDGTYPWLRPQCSNALDDDQDGRNNFPDDLGCSSPTDDREVDRGSSLFCSATAVRSGTAPTTVANAAYDPCVDADVSTGTTIGLITLNGQHAVTDAKPENWSLQPPAVGDYGRATAQVGAASIRLGTLVISVADVEATAQSRCTAIGDFPQATSSSSVGVLKIGSISLPLGSSPLDVPLGGATLHLNATIPGLSDTEVTRRAVWLDQPGEAQDIVLAEAKAGGFRSSCSVPG